MNYEAHTQEYEQRAQNALDAILGQQENPQWPEEPTEEQKAAMWDYYYNTVDQDQNNMNDE